MSQRQPTILFIFGGSGDLAHRKLMPALYNLYLDKLLPGSVSIIAIGRSDYTRRSYRNFIRQGIIEHSRRKNCIGIAWKEFSALIDYRKANLESASTYKTIKKDVDKAAAQWKAKPVVVYYMSVAPQLAPRIAEQLHAARLATDPHRHRIIFEKPFGHDLPSAQALNERLAALFTEEQIYRIDHYLGKETVQNILALRFANALFEPLFNSHYIDHVQLSATETVGVEGRGAYYEGAGALRDMVQNHMLQLLCMIAMEAPVSFAADEIRNKKLDVLMAIRKWSREEVHRNAVRGQYEKGWIEGKEVNAYRGEKGVDPESGVETFAALRLFVDNWRWKDVPFYLRTGKSMHSKSTVITVVFKNAPQFAFPPEAADTWRSNRLTISISPDMEIRLRFQAKEPGQQVVLQPVHMVFSYTEAYGDADKQPEAYETLLEDVIEGNPTLFMRADQVEASWKVVQPILYSWSLRKPVDFPNYAPGSWGPEDAEALIARDGRNWAGPQDNAH